jgi:sulfatase maturation enzyme AslB (radical SAM superfamily)
MHVAGFNQPKGDVYLCCPSWLDKVVGNIQLQSVEEVWNGKQAQELRRSILDGSFRFCDAGRCPFLQTASGPVTRTDKVTDPDLREAIDKQLLTLPYGPKEVNCSYDRSCNLSCPSCRTEHVIEIQYGDQITAIQERLEAAMSDTEYLYITGSGDAFGSPYFNRWLRTMNVDHLPKLHTIHLHTNAQLWTPKMWNMIPAKVRALIRDAEISIDAASSATYAINRRGGTFEQLLANLEFIRSLRAEGPLEYLKLSMVVQENNFHEMPEFVELGKRFLADTVYFGQLVNWGTYTDREFRNHAIHLPEHSRHQEFLGVLRHEAMLDSRVFLGNLAELALVSPLPASTTLSAHTPAW